ncbi:hypothetical protein ACJWDR_01520 [Streptomyces tauricus]|uniref:hypothetical protein n=1 Tax=Streptomyces tauricus TaxID=68274 RepID=UPI00387EF41A
MSTAGRVTVSYGASIDVLYGSDRGRPTDSHRGHHTTAELLRSLARRESTTTLTVRSDLATRLVSGVHLDGRFFGTRRPATP